MKRVVYGFDDFGRKVPVGSYDDTTTKPVGGKIFYIDSSSDEEVIFYNAQGVVIPSVSVGDTPAYYYISNPGISGKDKYYIYDNATGLVNKPWGYYDITTGVNTDTIGSGKTNTAAILNITDTSDYTTNSIFYYLSSTQNAGTGVNGCNDWFIGSKAELDALRNSNLETWFTNYYIWSSVEYSATNAWGWHYVNQYWYYDNKYDTSFQCCFFRAF